MKLPQAHTVKNVKTIFTVTIMIEKCTINNDNTENKWQVSQGKVVRMEEVKSARDINEFWASITSHSFAAHCFK